MKRYLSVLALDIRSSIYKVFLILTAMIGLQFVEFLAVSRRLETEAAKTKTYLGSEDITENVLPFTLDQVLEECHLKLIFLVAAAGIFAVLVWSAGDHGKSKIKHLLSRLRVNKGKIFAIWSGYHILCFILLIAVQVLAVTGMHAVYQETVADGRAPQALFMVFYRDSFLHGLLPLADWFRAVRVLSFVITWGLVTVDLGYRGLNSEKRRGWDVLLYTAIFLGFTVTWGIQVLWLEILALILEVLCSGFVVASALGKFGEGYNEASK